MLLHDTEELDNDLAGWADENLTLSRLLGVAADFVRAEEIGEIRARRT